jgi:hypothetical protein
MSLAFERLLSPATGHPEQLAADEPEYRLNITVVFTSAELTSAALRKAGTLASRLSGRITLVVPQVVPYPLPLESPPVLLEFSERRFREIATESPVDTTVRLYLCRDRLETLNTVLAPRSLVVLGGRNTWWPNADRTLARELRHAGHEVIFAGTE